MTDGTPTPKPQVSPAPPAPADSTAESRPQTEHEKHGKAWPLGVVVALPVAIVCLGLLWFFLQRHHGEGGNENKPTRTVAVATVERGDLYNEVNIPAEFRPYIETELNAKVSGFLQKINVDFGDKVKAGQLLAVLEVPELKADLDSAIAAHERAMADYTNAHLIYTRLVNVDKEHPNLVAQQDIDTAQAKDSSMSAMVNSTKADVEKYQTLFGYTQITAPFDGVITWRSADPGALIQAGTMSDTAARPVVRISDNYLLRLDFPVSVKYVKDVHVGAEVTVKVDSLGDKAYTGKITRFTDKVSDATRTMITEIEVKNPDLEIIPGMYAGVVLKVENRTNVLIIPTEGVASAKNSMVDVVNSNNEIEERQVVLGLETPNRYEVISGLNEGDRVVVGSQTQVHGGQKVDTKPWEAPQSQWPIPKGE